MKQEIITVFGKKYKAVAKFSNKEADMIEIEPLTEVDELKDRVESLESKIKALETAVTTLVDSLNNERELSRPRKHKNDLIANCKPRELF